MRLGAARLAAALAVLSCAPSAFAAETSAADEATDADRVAALVLRTDGAGRSFIAGKLSAEGAEAAAREWAALEKKKAAALASVLAAGEVSERRLVPLLKKWTGDGRAAKIDEERDFLEDASAQAALILAEPETRREVEEGTLRSSSATPDSSRSVERARQMSERGLGRVNGGLFGRDRTTQSVSPDGTGEHDRGAAQETTGRDDRTRAIVGGMTSGLVNGVADPTLNALTLAPAANVPGNFKRRIAEVPTPGATVGVASTDGANGGVNATAGGGTGTGSSTTGSRQRPAPFPEGGMRDRSKPMSVEDIALIERVFHETVRELTASGRRREGSGGWNGVANNVTAMWNDKRLRCYDQAEVLQTNLNKAFERRQPRDRWKFELTSYTGDLDHEKNGHWWLNAISREPGDPTLALDPWANTVKREDSKKPIVIKGYGAYWMGYMMDKITN